MKTYRVKLEIAGPTAMWTRPDTGDAPVSYPAPTFSAVKGIFESILLSDWAEVVPSKVEICQPIIFHTYSTNYGGPLRKSKNMKSGASYQMFATVLVNVCYRLYAELLPIQGNYSKHGRSGLQKEGTTNGPHAYQDRFERRIKSGKTFSVPCLGWKEFTPDYVGTFRENTRILEEINLAIPSMLRSCFSKGPNSPFEPVFDQNVKIERGVLLYAK